MAAASPPSCDRLRPRVRRSGRRHRSAPRPRDRSARADDGERAERVEPPSHRRRRHGPARVPHAAGGLPSGPLPGRGHPHRPGRPPERAGHATLELRETGGAAPVAITSFTPAGGAAGTEVVLGGTGFSTDDPADNVVSLAQIIADVVEVTPTSIRLIVPAGAGTGKLVVRNRLGVAVSDAFFTVPVSVAVTPADGEVVVSDSHQLEAAVVSSFFTDVRWSVNGIPGGAADVGTITPAGLYTAPADVPPGGLVTVAAALRADPAARGEVTVRVLPPPLTPGQATVLASTGGTVRSLDGGAQRQHPARGAPGHDRHHGDRAPRCGGAGPGARPAAARRRRARPLPAGVPPPGHGDGAAGPVRRPGHGAPAGVRRRPTAASCGRKPSWPRSSRAGSRPRPRSATSRPS